MLNLTSGQQNQWTTFDEYLMVKKGGGEVGGQCNELVSRWRLRLMWVAVEPVLEDFLLVLLISYFLQFLPVLG